MCIKENEVTVCFNTLIEHKCEVDYNVVMQIVCCVCFSMQRADTGY